MTMFSQYAVWDARLWCERCESPLVDAQESGNELNLAELINSATDHERTVHGPTV